MSNSGSEDGVNSDDEQAEYVDDEDEEEQQDAPSFVGLSSAETQQRSAGAPNAPLSTSFGLDLYSYEANLTDKQRRQQDECNFARAAGRERKSKTTADRKRRIRFDDQGNLQYSDDPETSEWQPAVFHHWIRRELAEAANRRGSYVFPRKAGREPGNETSFVESQRQWGTQREHYAPIMFQYEPPRNRTSPVPGPWRHNGRLVIDYWLRPLQNFEEIPQVLSSAYEGEFIEPAQRRNQRIKHVDVRQRMPPFIFRKGEPVPVTSANNLAKRNRFFRNRAGAIPWTKRDKASDKIKEYIDSVHAQQRPGRRGNDTRGCQDLTPEQIKDLFEINAGSKKRATGPEDHRAEQTARYRKQAGRQPSNTKGGASEPHVTSPPRRRSKRKHVSSEEGSPPPPPTQRGSSSLNTFNLPSIGGVLGIPARPKSHSAQDPSASRPPTSSTKRSRTDVPTHHEEDEESSSQSDASSDFNDRLYLPPTTPAEHESIQRLLQPTLAHYHHLTGFHIQDWDTTATYAEQVTEIEQAMHRSMDRLGRPRVDIIRIDEFNDERAVWNLAWDEGTFGRPLDLGGEVVEQLDGSGRRWVGGRWV